MPFSDGYVNRWDLAVLRAVYLGSAGTSWIRLAQFMSFVGSGWMLLGLVPLWAVPAFRPHRRRAIAMLAVLLFTSVLVTVVKELAGRVRPCHALSWAHMAGAHLPDDFSLPSGHSAGSFAAAAFVGTLYRRWTAPALTLALLVGLSRVALGVHYPSDVLIGALLGATVGLVSGVWFRHRGE